MRTVKTDKIDFKRALSDNVQTCLAKILYKRLHKALLISLVLLFIFIPITVNYASGNDTLVKKDSLRPLPISAINVVMDDNYPPFIFRDGEGKLQGILIDEWALWEKKTGVKVNLVAEDWNKAIGDIKA